jgi:AraC-like DNA-binding protein
MRARFEKVAVSATRSFHVQERRIARFDAPLHFHPEIELTLILESRGRRFVGDSIEPFAEGDLVLLGPNLPHFWHNDGRQAPGTKAHSLVVHFLPDFLGTVISEKPEFGPVNALLQRAARGLHMTGSRVSGLSDRVRQLTTLGGLAALLQLLAVFDELAHTPGARPLVSEFYEPRLHRHAEQRLARVYAFLMRNFREPLTLVQIARVASMNPQAFSRYFKRTSGRNVSVFINELRIDHAGRLLRESTQRIGDIAADAGFATLSSFNRRFRERMGCTPLRYRRSYVEANVSPCCSLSKVR